MAVISPYPESRRRVCYGVDASGDTRIVVRGVRTRGRVNCTPVDGAAPALAADVASGRAVAAGCLLERESLTHWLDAPFPSMAKAQRIFPTLMDIRLPFPIEECAYALADFSSGGGRNARLLAAVARFEDVERRIAALEAMGVDAAVLDQEGLALWTQSLHEMPMISGRQAEAGSGPVRVVVYVGPDRMTIALGRSEEFLAAYGARQARPDDASRFLQATLGTVPSSLQWVFAGPAARGRAPVEALYRELAAKWPAPLLVHADPETFLARALATRALLAGPLRCNLRTGRFTHPSVTRIRRRSALTTAALFLAAGLLLCGGNAAWRMAAARKEAQVQSALTRISSQISGLDKPPKGNELLVARRAFQAGSEKWAPFARAFEPSLTLTLRELLHAGQKHGLRFGGLTLRNGAVLIEGAAEDWNQCDKFSSWLEREGHPNKLERREALAEEKVRFTISPVKAP